MRGLRRQEEGEIARKSRIKKPDGDAMRLIRPTSYM
ncbi:hypothetical protein CKO_04788 [Citrobacter koseri ATCC BAA-895]|uniref:Uncharacterized protein n=1 Tax=Citrobacter koseri (strain ATCC BAA-895 / CDC 4225-83 / SGSC4696) TaxID=290338 RepID=A8AQS0_CITK8|nr:hypothetical protein CKO_04788 [Citrobacter koseri ATCC BAA-895]